MTFSIFGINTQKISLVTKDENPAVPKATTGFAMFKTLGFGKKKSSLDMKKIEELQKRLAE